MSGGFAFGQPSLSAQNGQRLVCNLFTTKGLHIKEDIQSVDLGHVLTEYAMSPVCHIMSKASIVM